METQLLNPSPLRRSDRVSIAFALEVAGTDLAGKRFSERTNTTTVSRFGCCLPLAYSLQLGQTLQMRRIGTNEIAVGRVVVPMGTQGQRRLYGVGTRDSCEGLWGIRFSTSYYEKLLDNLHDAVYFINRDRKITYWNEAAERLSGNTAGEVIGKGCFDNLLGYVDESGTPLCNSRCPLSEVMLDGQPRQANVYLRHKQGYRVPADVRILPLRNSDGGVVGAVEVLSDSTGKKNAEKRVSELERLAFLDALTGLPNRRYLQMKVEQSLQEHIRFSRLYGLLMFDVDRFKLVNDTYGHEVGDAMLKAVAGTVVRDLRPVDVVGRWGGEEFLVLMPDLDAVRLGDLAERCRTLISRTSVAVGSSRVSVTASIGASVLNHNDSAESAIRRVDGLMYQSKRSGGDRTTAG